MTEEIYERERERKREAGRRREKLVYLIIVKTKERLYSRYFEHQKILPERHVLKIKNLLYAWEYKL